VCNGVLKEHSEWGQPVNVIHAPISHSMCFVDTEPFKPLHFRICSHPTGNLLQDLVVSGLDVKMLFEFL
jgi:hypothetical protein